VTRSTRRRSSPPSLKGLWLLSLPRRDSDDSHGFAAEVWTYIWAVERSGLEGSDESEYSSDEEDSSEEGGGGDGGDDDDDDDGGDGDDDDDDGDGGSRGGNGGGKGGDGGGSSKGNNKASG
jgi:hypothetical protein